MISWEEFKEKYNIPFYSINDEDVIYPDNKCKEFFDKYMKYYKYKPKLTQWQYSSLKDLSATYTNLKRESVGNSKIENHFIEIYIKWCCFNEINSELAASLENNIKFEDEKFLYDLKLHKRYKRLYYIGIFLWMSVNFWAPFLLGLIINGFSGNDFTYCVIMGCGYVLVWSFTMPVTIPLSFFIGLYLHPKMLRYIIFNKEHPYCEGLMNTLNHSSSQEKSNAAAVVAGTALGKFSSK